MIKFIKEQWDKIIFILSFGLMLFLFESSVFFFLLPIKWTKYWIIIPCITYASCFFFKKTNKNYLTSFTISFSNALSLAVLFINIITSIGMWYKTNYLIISFCIVFIAIIGFMVVNIIRAKDQRLPNKTSTCKLFNLFYLNTSKAHEIAMLIDNKIMKSIENEQISEDSKKHGSSISFGKKDAFSSEIGYSSEESSKQRVFESFDVKNTKSIMLRTIYENVEDASKKALDEGNLVLFENVELQQLNVDDTVMILNVLQDSKIKNQTSDDIEINLNKMMDKMLDDFTIDYSFPHIDSNGKEETYLIRLPYKSTSNFENGYQHNDLQLGKLSIIGIYRGKIDFSQKESVSSKFLDLLDISYKQQKNTIQENNGMKLSYTGEPANNVDFNFNHKKIEAVYHLIDVIAIIQEINFVKDKS